MTSNVIKSPPLKIAFFMGRYALGGAATFTNEYLKIFREVGWNSVLIAGVPSPDEPMPTDMPEPILVKSYRRSPNPFRDIAALIEFIKVLRHLKPDILITQSAKAGIIGRLAGKLVGIPVIIHVFQGHLLKNYFPPLISRAFILIEQIAAHWCDQIVLPRQTDVEDFVTELRIAPRKKLTVISAPIEIATEPVSDKLRQRAGAKVIRVGTLCRLAKVKNIEFALAVFKELCLKNPESNFELILGGSGPEEGRLKGVVAADPLLAKRVKFVGIITDRRSFYDSLDTLLHTSKHEGHGVIVLEALAAGLPVLSSPEGLVTELNCSWARVISLKKPVKEWAENLHELLHEAPPSGAKIDALRLQYRQLFGYERTKKDWISLLGKLSIGNNVP